MDHCQRTMKTPKHFWRKSRLLYKAWQKKISGTKCCMQLKNSMLKIYTPSNKIEKMHRLTVYGP